VKLDFLRNPCNFYIVNYRYSRDHYSLENIIL
jgi:hypothetical protein